MRHETSAGDFSEQLRAAGLGNFFRPVQAEQAGISRDQLPALVRRGVVEHVARGLYRVAGAEPTEHYSLGMVSARVPESIVCLLSALSVHGIGTGLPHDVWIAIPHKAREPRIPLVRIRVVRFSGNAWTYGVEDTEFEGVPARITSPARTIVDCFRYERLIGREAALEALRDGLRQRTVSIDALQRTVDMLPSRRLFAALETLSY